MGVIYCSHFVAEHAKPDDCKDKHSDLKVRRLNLSDDMRRGANDNNKYLLLAVGTVNGDHQEVTNHNVRSCEDARMA
jgi:hypothetical protein